MPQIAPIPTLETAPFPSQVRRQTKDFPLLHVPREFSPYLNEPLPQRSAGSSGKRGQCSLAFHVRQERTVLQHSFVSHPFHFTHPWSLDPHLPDMAVVYIQTPAGGLIQGDQALMQFSLDPGARVHITTQAAEKIHTMTANCAVQHIAMRLADEAYAEYCPEPIILFPGARFTQHLHIELGARASIFLSDIFFVPAGRAWFEAFANCLTICDTNGRLLLHERSIALPAQRPLDGPGILGGHRVWGQAVFSGSPLAAHLVKDLSALLTDQPGVICGATLLPQECGVAVKVVGAHVPAVRQVLHTAWHWLREHHLQAPALRFPK